MEEAAFRPQTADEAVIQLRGWVSDNNSSEEKNLLVTDCYIGFWTWTDPSEKFKPWKSSE
jgi:hypothetical protein